MDIKKIKIRLIKLGLTQTELGRKLGIPRNRVNDAISGRREGKKYQCEILAYLYPGNRS
jgi:transcriptional regulator with XRE-family HTH domain